MKMLNAIGVALISLVIDANGHVLDLCSIGRDGSNTILNGNWSYKGTDSFGKEEWYAECDDVKLVWGQQFNSGYNFYMMAPKNGTGFYAYCNLADTAPDACDAQWFVYDSTAGWEIDADFVIELCSYYTGQSNCVDYSYLTSLSIDPTTAYCIDNAQYRTDFNGNWEYVGCDEGLPYYQLQESSSTLYIYYDWCFSWWFVGPDITSTTVSGYCATWDFVDCNNNLYEYDTIQFQLDSSVEIDLCTPRPTDSPSPQPTSSPVDPTSFPSDLPTPAPSDPSTSPTTAPSDPTPSPTQMPTDKPSNNPTVLPTSMPVVSTTMLTTSVTTKSALSTTRVSTSALSTTVGPNPSDGGGGGQSSTQETEEPDSTSQSTEDSTSMSTNTGGSGSTSTGGSGSTSPTPEDTDDSGDSGDSGDSDDSGDNQGSSVSNPFNDMTGSTLYLVAGLGALLLCCWLFCCVWYARRRQAKLDENSKGLTAQDEDRKIAKLQSVASASSVEMGATNAAVAGAAAAGAAPPPGGQVAQPMSNAQFAFNIAAQETNGTGVNPGEGGAGGTGATTVPQSNAMYEAQMQAVREQQLQLEKQKLEIQQMQNNLRMQQMQSQAMMQQQMHMLNNVSMMPQPMVQAVNATGNGEGPGLAPTGFNGAGGLGGPGAVPMGNPNGMNFQLNMNNNINPNNLPMLPTNPVAHAFTNGVAHAAMGEGGTNGDNIDDDDSSDADVLADGNTTGGIPPVPPVPPSFQD